VEKVLTQLRTPGLFGEVVIASVLFWSVAFVVLLVIYKQGICALCTSMPASAAFIPAALPHVDPPGLSPEFEVPLLSATERQLTDFAIFRKVTVDKSNRGAYLQALTHEACKYKGELLDTKVMIWEKEHFIHRKKGLFFPVPSKHWYGWSGYWLEVGPYKRNQSVGNLVFCTQHFLCGFLLPINYIFGKQLGLPYGGDEINFTLALYGDVGANLVASALCVLSYILGKNLTLEQYSKSLWHLCIMHHMAAAGLEAVGLLAGEQCDRELACMLLISLLGTTGALHLFLTPAACTPLKDSLLLTLLLQAVTTGAMLWFRVLYWCVLAVRILTVSWATGQSAATITFISFALLLFTAFNNDFVKFHWKNLNSNYKQWTAGKNKSA